jgi:adenine-specific DNA-methyltransferase
MKYMGHKGRVLKAIRAQVARFTNDANVLCDPFCGSAVVAWDLAEQFEKPVIAGDLQSFATARAAAILMRTEALTDLSFVEAWFQRANDRIEQATQRLRIPPPPSVDLKKKFLLSRAAVLRARKYVANTFRPNLSRSANTWPVTVAYAGYYFSIQQALALDALRSTLPEHGGERAVALSALIAAASRCSASPGHTAQPLGIKKSSLPHVVDAWNRAVFDYITEEIKEVAPRHARMVGETKVGSWETLIQSLHAGDVAFCDPPYSDVQYSRFYHVLETLSRGIRVSVSGSGRNPPFAQRPESDFSRKSRAKAEVEKLMKLASDRHVRLVITFPVSRQSNGLDAATFAGAARRYFPHVDNEEVRSIFSSLGGNGENGARPAREERTERIICCYHD